MKPAAESVALRVPSPWQRLWSNPFSRVCLLAILLYTLAALWGEGVYRYYRGTLLPGCPALTWAPERQAPYNELHMESRYVPLCAAAHPRHLAREHAPRWHAPAAAHASLLVGLG